MGSIPFVFRANFTMELRFMAYKSSEVSKLWGISISVITDVC